MELTDILSNPTRFRIIQYLLMKGEGTTKQMTEELNDVPAPTIYRHVNFLLKEDILKVKQEKRIRGTTERLLCINGNKWSAMVNSDIAGTAYQFLMSIYGQFNDYARTPDADPAADRLCMRSCMMHLSDDVFDSFLQDYASLLNRYLGMQDGGRLRSVSIISAPVKEEE